MVEVFFSVVTNDYYDTIFGLVNIFESLNVLNDEIFKGFVFVIYTYIRGSIFTTFIPLNKN